MAVEKTLLSKSREEESLKERALELCKGSFLEGVGLVIGVSVTLYK